MDDTSAAGDGETDGGESGDGETDHRTVVVTGASAGVGAAVARRFGRDGATVVACSRDEDGLSAVLDDVEAAGGTAAGHRADVRDEFDVERLMETAARVGGPIDVLVANAAVAHGRPGETPLSEESYSAFDDTMRTNARGVFAAVTEAVPHLAADARVVVPSGSVAREAAPGMGAYAVSKAAAEALARGFAADLPQTVGVADLGLVATDLSGGRGRDPSEAAAFVRWAAVEADAELVDGGVVGVDDWRAATE